MIPFFIWIKFVLPVNTVSLCFIVHGHCHWWLVPSPGIIVKKMRIGVFQGKQMLSAEELEMDEGISGKEGIGGRLDGTDVDRGELLSTDICHICYY